MGHQGALHSTVSRAALRTRVCERITSQRSWQHCWRASHYIGRWSVERLLTVDAIASILAAMDLSFGVLQTFSVCQSQNASASPLKTAHS